jgi:ABC-type nitrate/sulfonate/bicarbonate transport system permease component
VNELVGQSAAPTVSTPDRPPRLGSRWSLRRLIAGATALSGLVLVLLAWQVVSSLVLPRMGGQVALLFPPPTAALQAALDLWQRGQLAQHVTASFQRVLVAWSLAALGAVPLGLAMGWWRPLAEQLDPVVEALRPIPPIAWIPIGLAWFGIGNTQNQFIVFLGAFFPILLNTVYGTRTIEPSLLRSALSLGARKHDLLFNVMLFAALPSIFTGLRLGMGSSWASLVAAELVGATSGLGFLLQDARNLLRTDRVILGMVLIGLSGLLCNIALEWLAHRMMPWRVERRA